MMIHVLGLCHFVFNQRLYLKWKVKVGSDLSFSLWMFYGNKLSLSSTIGNELDQLPEKPKSLVFLCYSDVETDLYEKGVSRVMLTAPSASNSPNALSARAGQGAQHQWW